MERLVGKASEGPTNGVSTSCVSEIILAAPSRLQGLARDVSEVQARLLAFKMTLKEGDANFGYAGIADGDDDEESAPREDEIIALSDRVGEMEHDLAGLAAAVGAPDSGAGRGNVDAGNSN